MATKLEPGVVRIGHTRSGSEDVDEVVVAEIDDRGVLVSWPRALGFVDAIRLNARDREVPEPLILRDSDGWLTLTEGHATGVSASTLGHSLERLRYSRAIHSGANGVGYTEVNGMTSEIDGLAKWANRVPVTTELKFGQESKCIDGITIVAKNLDSLPLGGPFNLQLETSYSHNPTPMGGVYTISTALQVRTRSAEIKSWETHQQTHRMMQDLMCLVYGKPCGSHLISVMREDDQDRPPTDERRFWKEAYQPSFGRAVDLESRLTDRDEPLFYLEETEPDLVADWLSDYSYWSRPTWIAMSAIFHHTLPVESRLLQVAVALEALGYAIAEKDSPGKRASTNYQDLLKSIFNSLGYEPVAVVGQEGDGDSWCRAFNAAYKGVKHADNKLTGAWEAWSRAREGLILIRCWVASTLGVHEELITQRLRESHGQT